MPKEFENVLAKKDLYAEAAKIGKLQADMNGELTQDGKPMTETERVLFWTARHAARQTACALLAEAQRIGLTDEQREALRVVAADVAYD